MAKGGKSTDVFFIIIPCFSIGLHLVCSIPIVGWIGLITMILCFSHMASSVRAKMELEYAEVVEEVDDVISKVNINKPTDVRLALAEIQEKLHGDVDGDVTGPC